MSTASHDTTGSHDHGAAHNSSHFWTGSILAIILTIIPFWLVMAKVIQDPATVGIIIFALALIQIIVHVVYFLHVNKQSENGWTLLSFIFTSIVVFLTIGGSILVMSHLNDNMMPMPTDSSAQTQQAMPGMH